ncbi:hypothetical protein SFOMI_3156 [Sphingobium fuliginis]|uniref:Uncharacterized protein n=1 Tax=Sphingobium fuliginis (strain ATCC 27551) TaxID=336203 RepID=A0A292ZGM9_SPHSA|nr:hypothetical protein SFOMI_3156 [Sphingobium fuliginis]
MSFPDRRWRNALHRRHIIFIQRRSASPPTTARRPRPVPP